MRRGLRPPRRGTRARAVALAGHQAVSGELWPVVLAGGYAANVQDTVAIHTNTALAAKEIMEAEVARRP